MLLPKIKTAISCSLTSLLLILTVSAWGADKSKDEETIKNATAVLQAMLDSKAVPGSLLVTAKCIIVLPGVKKFAVGVGGSGGRGPMTCRDGQNFTGSKWVVHRLRSSYHGAQGSEQGAGGQDKGWHRPDRGCGSQRRHFYRNGRRGRHFELWPRHRTLCRHITERRES